MHKKNQHYIPQSYLKAWCDPNCPSSFTPYIWCFSKDGNIVKKKAPENVFYEKDMYTIHLEDGSRNLTIENGLSELESLFVGVRDGLIFPKRDLDFDSKIILCAFIAAMHARTKDMREHLRKQFKKPLEIADDIKQQLEEASPSKRKQIINSLSGPHSSEKSFSYMDIKNIVDNPLQTSLLPIIGAETPLLLKLDFAILIADGKDGFITSDSPCVWFDSLAYQRPPWYRAPALMYETIEITLPVSPSALVLLNRKGLYGYRSIQSKVVDDLNRRTRFHSEEYFVVNSNFKKALWFDPGVKPDDSWEKKNSTGT